MHLVVVADSLEQSQPLIHAAGDAGYRIVKFVGPDDEVALYTTGMQVDAVVFVSDEFDWFHAG